MKVDQLVKVAVMATLLAGAPAQAQPLSISDEAEAVFGLAALLYPELFTNGDPLDLYEGYIYRFFPESGIYVGVKDDEIYLLGGPFGDEITRQGTVNEVRLFLEDEAVRLEVDLGGGIAEGEYTLSITGSGEGTTTVQGFTVPISVPFDITFENIAAPDPDDLDQIEDMILESLEGVSEITDLEVVVLNSSASNITFDVNFNALFVAEGATADLAFNLRYNYVK